MVSDAVPAEARHLASELMKESQSLMTQFIADGQRQGQIVSGDPEHLAFQLGASMQGLAFTAAAATDLDAQPSADSLTRLFIASV
ncbi:hypothetical protein GCM10025857_16270 [Alicyclobacillus contaminans]|nr:hypothetical protein GCM10025857_16270 [Alicyclobacillus contaminans]